MRILIALVVALIVVVATSSYNLTAQIAWTGWSVAADCQPHTPQQRNATTSYNYSKGGTILVSPPNLIWEISNHSAGKLL